MVNPLKCLIPCCFRSDGIEVPVVRLQGMIAARLSSLKNTQSLSGCAVVLEKAFRDKKSPAVALIINSPGGSPVQSRLIFRRIRDLAEENRKHVFVFVEDVAASGGYMIACAGDEIYADPSSIIGSIGVVSSSFGFSAFLEKIGVERRVYTAGKNKALLDPFKPEKKEDVEHLKALQLEIHEIFIAIVKERRHGCLKDNDDIFSGMFWTGIQGKEMGLVDGLGDIRSVLKTRYGEKTRLRLIPAPRNVFGYKSASINSNFVSDSVDILSSFLEEWTLRERYGL